MWIMTEDKHAINADKLLEIYVSSCRVLCRAIGDDQSSRLLGVYETEDKAHKVFSKIVYEVAAGKNQIVMPKSDYTEPEKSFTGVPRGLFDEGQI